MRLASIERTIDDGRYLPGPWQQFIADLREAARPRRVALADEVARVSRKLHLWHQRYTVGVRRGLFIETLAVGGRGQYPIDDPSI